MRYPGRAKILADLRDDGEIISRKTVAKVTRRLGLRGICPKRWRTTTIIDRADAYPVDAVKRQWDTGELNPSLGMMALFGDRHRRSLTACDRVGD